MKIEFEDNDELLNFLKLVKPDAPKQIEEKTTRTPVELFAKTLMIDINKNEADSFTKEDVLAFIRLKLSEYKKHE